VTGSSATTYDWACRTGGSLTPAQRAEVKAAIRRSYLDLTKGLLTWAFRRPPARTALPEAPRSRLSSLAEEAAAEQDPALRGHGYRTWLLGSVLAGHDRRDLDPELFYVAALLHDSGMMQAVVGEDFTIRSARQVLELCARTEPLDPGTGLQLADAVVAHASPGLTPEQDRIGWYVQAGAMADLAGLRMWDLPRGYLRAAYAAHPAADVHRIIPDLIRREAVDVPEGRFALLHRAGMAHMVRLSPTRRWASATAGPPGGAAAERPSG
jgi:hypothetical protein